jgi:3-hydroxyisobutyrate dehydrogenase-like beta-hydroxyacid dehydrogenase
MEGFIGLATVGAVVTTSLHKVGYKLVMHDIRQNLAKPHHNTGAQWADYSRCEPVKAFLLCVVHGPH